MDINAELKKSGALIGREATFYVEASFAGGLTVASGAGRLTKVEEVASAIGGVGVALTIGGTELSADDLTAFEVGDDYVYAETEHIFVSCNVSRPA